MGGLPLTPDGLALCCTTTHAVRAPAAFRTRPGDRLDCRDCSTELIAAVGADGLRWQRNHPVP